MGSKIYIRKKLVKHTKNSIIMSLFLENFEEAFTVDEWDWDKIKMAFDWLKEEAKDARYFSDINAIDKCRRMSESYFSKIECIKTKVLKESKKVNRELRKRFDELRTRRKSRKGKLLLILEGEHEDEKALPPQ